MPTHRILLDNNVPVHLISLLHPHVAVHAAGVGWAALQNGDLIRVARRAGYGAIITCDRNMKHQQNLATETLAFIVLTTTHWPTIRDNVPRIAEALARIAPGSYEVVYLPKPPRRRRPFSPQPKAE
jgi:hypothetical protein